MKRILKTIVLVGGEVILGCAIFIVVLNIIFKIFDINVDEEDLVIFG